CLSAASPSIRWRKIAPRSVIRRPARPWIPCRRATTRTCNRRFRQPKTHSKSGPMSRPKIAALLTQEQGKTLFEAGLEIHHLVHGLEFYAGLASKVRGAHVPLPQKGA